MPSPETNPTPDPGDITRLPTIPPDPDRGPPYCLALYQGDTRIGFLPRPGAPASAAGPIDRYYSTAGVRRAASRRAGEFAPLLRVVPYDLIAGAPLGWAPPAETDPMPLRDEEMPELDRPADPAPVPTPAPGPHRPRGGDEARELARAVIDAHRDALSLVARLCCPGCDCPRAARAVEC